MQNRRERERSRRYRRGMGAKAAREATRRMLDAIGRRGREPQAKTPRIPKAEMEDNLPFDPELWYDRESKRYPQMLAEMDRFIEALSRKPCPANLRPPIASGPKREAASRRNVEALLANIHAMLERGKPTLSVSLSPNTYSGKGVNAGIINLFKLADHFGYLILAPGFFNDMVHQNSRLARIKPTKKLMDLLSPKASIAYDLDDVIILRRTENRRQADYTTKKVKHTIPRHAYEKGMTLDEKNAVQELRTCVDYFNLVLSDYPMSYVKDGKRVRLPKLAFRRIFTGTLDRGGRFYTKTGTYQNLSKRERQTVRFKCADGRWHTTAELDYSGLHIRMLYEMAGYPYPLDDDPYDAVFDALGTSRKAIERRLGGNVAESIRNDFKEMLLALVNGTVKKKDTRWRTALRRANHRLFRENKTEGKRRLRRWRKAGLLDRNDGAKRVLEAFKTAHKPIRRYFATGCGLDLQRIDSEIADYVLREMMFGDRPIPTLPLHDSFRTLRIPKYQRKLEKAMKFVYRGIIRKHVGGDSKFQIRVKQVRVRDRH